MDFIRRSTGHAPRRPQGSPKIIVFGVALLAALPVLPLASGTLSAQEAQPVRITTDLGFVNSAGNTSVTTFNIGEEMTFSTGLWGVKQTFGVIYGETEGETSASSWRASVRGDRAIGNRLGIYAMGAFDRNTFAGISRRFEEGLGLLYKAIQDPARTLEFEAGAGLTQQRSTEAVESSFATARGAATFRQGFGENSHFALFSEVIPNLEESEDLRVNAQADLVAPLSSSIAMKLSYVLRFDNLPEPTFGKTDRQFTAGLQITL